MCIRSIQTKKQPIINEIRIVNSVKVHYYGIRHAAELDQMVPVAAVACQSRSLDAKDSARFTAAHLGHQALKSRALDESRSRTPQIFVDHDDLLKPQVTGSIHQPVLASLAFLMMEHLVW